MKTTCFTILSSIILTLCSLAGDALPFTVSVGGQAAKDGTPFAKLADPVAANATIEIGAKADMIIINVHKTKADGTPDEKTVPAVILLQGTTKGTLEQTMDKKKIPAGNYLISVSAGEKTATIQCTIQ
jgi:hypothetical protein